MEETVKRLTELIAAEKLHQMQVRLSDSSNVVAVILDAEGVPVNDLCTLKDMCGVRDETGGESCTPLHRTLFEQVKESCQPELDVCPNSGLTAAAIPIYNRDGLVCVWVLCQFLYWTCVDQVPQAMIQERKVPVFNHSALTLLINFITMLTEDMLQIRREEEKLTNYRDAFIGDVAMYDYLLGLPNRLCMQRDLQESNDYRHLIIVDIGDLRKINDVYGREFGDLLLKALRDYLRGLGLSGSRLYRLDVADFAILLEEQDEETLRQTACSIYEHCSKPWRIGAPGGEENIFTTINIGVLPVSSPNDAESFQNLISAIEHTMDIARKTDYIAYFNDAETAVFRNKLRLEMSLRRCVRDNMKGFYLVYQPIVDPGVAIWRGVEALCRWESDEFGQVSPGEFIHIAESTGLIGAIGQWVLEQAVAQAKEWGLDKGEHFVLDVNLSPVQLANPDLDKDVEAVLLKYNYPPNKLCLEITESSALDFSKHSLQVLNRLRDMGVVLALDDFGTGYASLNMLHKIPVSIVKTDRSLINGVENDSFLIRLFYVLVEMAHASDMKIVAEGVETDSQAHLLLKEGADYFQGFRFSKPLSVEEMGSMLNHFDTPSRELVSMGYARVDLSRLSDTQGGYALTPSLYRLLNRCMQTLFAVPDVNDAIEDALAVIGRELGMSRSYVFLKDDNGLYSNSHEWCAPGIKPEKDNLQNQDIEGVSPEWIGTLIQEGMLVASDINTLSSPAVEHLSAQGIKAVAEFPFWKNGKFMGFVGFDDCEGVHYWSREEVQMLHTLSGMISSMLSLMQMQDKYYQQSRRMETILGNMDTCIHVSDLETGEILFANTEMQRTFNHSLVGEICWEILQNHHERCDFCPVTHLLENPGEVYQWENYIERAGSHFRIQDILIPWDQGRMAHFQCALNITELKKYQLRLEEFVSTDTLTKTLSRSGFFSAAHSRLEETLLHRRNLALGFIDIDGLKAENDLYGHTAGDEMIRTIVGTLRRNIRTSDHIGRYGGDEFLVLFDNCDKAHAECRMAAALEELENISVEGKANPNYSFSYGLADCSEITSHGTPEDVLERLINLADMRMICQKRRAKRQRVR